MCGVESSLEINIYARRGGIEAISPNISDIQSLSDEELLRRCARGQDAAMQELVRRHQASVYRFLARYLGSTEDAEQAALNVFVRAWQHAPRFQFRCRVTTWLYHIAVNIAHDLYKRRQARVQEEPWPTGFERTPHPSGNAEHEAFQRLQCQEEFQTLYAALDQMSESDRLLLVLYYFEERTYEEIQEIAQVSYKVLKTRLARARQRLRLLVETENKKAMP